MVSRPVSSRALAESPHRRRAVHPIAIWRSAAHRPDTILAISDQLNDLSGVLINEFNKSIPAARV